ncbi:TAXI family TRAP transporter solute-binding subunit [Rhodopila globiformis]|nr:TAXI family TRAP transporter solute-binding subunit [Rhodopila globiformis]
MPGLTSRCRRAGLLRTRLAAAAMLLPLLAHAQTAAPAPSRIAQAPNATVGLIGGPAGSTDARIAADMAIVLDDADRLRILPIQGEGSVQNIADLAYLKGVDVAIVQTDALAQTMQRAIIAREGSVQYIAKLFQEEIHILARKNIAGPNDLNGQKVEIGPVGSGGDMTARTLLDELHVKAALHNDPASIALERLRQGDSAAMILVGGAPIPLLQTVPPGTGLHFLPIPLNAQLVENYLPSKLGPQQYPSLMGTGEPVDTVAVGAALITLSAPPDSLRAKRVNRFVDTLFERFAQFRQPGLHPKWSEVSLSAQLPGWTRYPEAQLQVKYVDQARENKLRASFDTYLQQSGQPEAGMDADRRQALFQDFLRWRDKQKPP